MSEGNAGESTGGDTGTGLFGGETTGEPAPKEPGDSGDFQLGEWASGLSDTNKNLATKQEWESLDAAFSSYSELRGNMDGHSRLTLPDNADDAAGWDAAMAKLGMPDTAEDYEFTKRKEGQSDLGEKFREWAREKRLSQTQASGMLDKIHAHQDEHAKLEDDKFIAQRMEARTELADFWGDDAQQNERLAGETAMQVLGLDNEMVTAIERQLGTRETMETFLRIGKDLGSHEGAGQGGSGEGLGGMSRSQAQARLAEIMNPDGPELERFANGDPAMNTEVQKLNTIIHGTKALLDD